MHKRIIKAKDLLEDIRNRLSDSQLMSTYGLSPVGLQGVFIKLIETKAVRPEELYDRAPVLEKDGIAVESIRTGRHQELEIPIPVHDAVDPRQVGLLRDLTPTGVGVRGIETRKGEVKTLIVAVNHLFPVDVFSFVAVCSWIKTRRSDGMIDAGFEITKISKEAEKLLRTTIKISAMDRVCAHIARPFIT